MFRNWHHALFLGPMPGTEYPLQSWLDQVDEAGISVVVCLNPEEEISLLSPEYRDWRRAAPRHAPVVRFDVPIEDGSAPEGTVVEKFWYTAAEIAEQSRADHRIFIHCTAGRGRTGMFGVAVLMQLGYSLVDAATEMYEVGSHPETSAQESFLEQSLP